MGKIESAIARIAGQRVYIDTNIFIYFLDRHPTYFDAVAALFQAGSQQGFFATTGDIAVAEVMVGPYRQGDPALVARFKRFFEHKNLLTVAAHERSVFDTAAMLSGQKRLKFIDALHVATALSLGCRFLLTDDAGIASVSGPEVIQLGSLLG